MSQAIKEISKQLDLFFEAAPFSVINTKKLSKTIKGQRKRKLSSRYIRDLQNVASFRQYLFKTASRLLLNFNRYQTIAIKHHTNIKLKKIQFNMWNRQELDAKISLVRQIMTNSQDEILGVSNRELKIYLFKHSTNINLVNTIILETVRAIESFINMWCSQKQKIKPIPTELIHFITPSLIDYHKKFKSPNQKQFTLILKAVEVRYSDVVRFYQYLITFFKAQIQSKWTVKWLHSQKRINPYDPKQQGLWNSQKDSKLMQIISRGHIYFRQYRNAFFSLYPECYNRIRDGFINNRIQFLLRTQLKRIKTLALQDKSNPKIIQASTRKITYYFSRRVSYIVRSMLGSSYSHSVPKKDIVRMIINAFNDNFAQNRKFIDFIDLSTS